LAGLRQAYQHEPALMLGSGMDQVPMTFIRAAMAQLPAQ
jgi:hypothetical protein